MGVGLENIQLNTELIIYIIKSDRVIPVFSTTAAYGEQE